MSKIQQRRNSQHNVEQEAVLVEQTPTPPSRIFSASKSTGIRHSAVLRIPRINRFFNILTNSRRWQRIVVLFIAILLLPLLIFIVILSYIPLALIIHAVLTPLVVLVTLNDKLSSTFALLFLLTPPTRALIGLVWQHLHPYPSFKRRVLALIFCIAESTLYIIQAQSSPFTISVPITALITSCLVMVAECWIWTSEPLMEHHEHHLLRLLGVEASETNIEGISTLAVKTPPNIDPSNLPVLIMLHGYATGKALYGNVLSDLSHHYNVYCLDWLGFARSHRTHKFQPKNIDETHDFFVDSLERWRQAMNIERFHLLGHSMGGYFAGTYALKHQSRVERLFMVSPVGLPRSTNVPWVDSESRLQRCIARLWNLDCTPLSLLRLLGPLGPVLFYRICDMRFAEYFTPDQIKALSDYLYHVNAGPQCGDVAITRILSAGAWSRQALAPRLVDLQCPATFLYGEYDWMSYEAALPVIDALRINHSSVDAKHQHHSRIFILRQAGHQVFIMNASAFVSIVVEDGHIERSLDQAAPSFEKLIDDRVMVL